MLKDNNYEETDIKLFQCFIKKLIYLLYNTGLDIVFVIEQLNKQNKNLKIGHLKVAKQVLKYFKKTMHLKTTYKADKVKLLPHKLTKYINYNYAKY